MGSFAAHTLVISNSILANSTFQHCSGALSVQDNGGNLADTATCGTVPATLTGLDPVLADNGGPTQTHALLAGSSAIDAAGACGLATDQRGVARTAGLCDSGAFEFGDLVVTPTLACVGFDPPMHQSPVTVKGKKRALPLKAELLDDQSIPVSDLDIVAPPSTSPATSCRWARATTATSSPGATAAGASTSRPRT